VPDERLNRPFREWKATLAKLRSGDDGRPQVRRIGYGDDDAFQFLAQEHVKVSVLGPQVKRIGGRDGLCMLHAPGSKRHSDSHTINGHSVVLKLTYGNVRFLLGGDINEEAQELLVSRTRGQDLSLAAEVFKVPHHGSADFSPRLLEAVRPVVSIVSSGDESSSTEYIHPRSCVVGALGKYARATVVRPLVYVTEMVAFFERIPKTFRDYRKTQYGIVHVRTDGERVLTVTHSGKPDQKESYAFTVDERGDVEFLQETRVV
jgi:hypothetical protein